MEGRTPEKIVTVQRTRMSVTTIYPNLLEMMTQFEMRVVDVACLLQISEQAMRRRLLGRANGGTDITAYECHILCEYFKKPFEWLFATAGDVA